MARHRHVSGCRYVSCISLEKSRPVQRMWARRVPGGRGRTKHRFNGPEWLSLFAAKHRFNGPERLSLFAAKHRFNGTERLSLLAPSVICSIMTRVVSGRNRCFVVKTADVVSCQKYCFVVQTAEVVPDFQRLLFSEPFTRLYFSTHHAGQTNYCQPQLSSLFEYFRFVQDTTSNGVALVTVPMNVNQIRDRGFCLDK